jgi:hypothetical protein
MPVQLWTLSGKSNEERPNAMLEQLRWSLNIVELKPEPNISRGFRLAVRMT